MRIVKSSVGPSAFEILGLPDDAGIDEIRAAYRNHARQLHPGHGVATDSEAARGAFEVLNGAFREAVAARVAADNPAPRRATPAGSAELATVLEGRIVAPRIGAQADRRSGADRPVRSSEGSYARHRPYLRVVESTASVVPGQRSVRSPLEADPLLVMLTVPLESETWSTKDLEWWALTLVPAARQYLSQARATAARAGARTDQHFIAATAHTLITTTIEGLEPRGVTHLQGALGRVYDHLETYLPPVLVSGLPARPELKRGMLEGLMTAWVVVPASAVAVSGLAVMADWTGLLAR